MLHFNGRSSNEFDVLVHAIGRDILPPILTRLVDIPSGVGAYDFGTKLDSRTITVSISIKSSGFNKVAEKMRDVAEWLYTEGLAELSFDDEPGKHYMARLSGSSNIQEVFTLGKGTLTFVCPNPLAISEDITSINPAVINNGTYQTHLIVNGTASGVSEYYKLTQLETGKYINFIGTFKEGDKIMIDFAKKQAFLNGISMLDRLDLESDFFPLPVGLTTLVPLSTTPFTSTYTYTEKFL